MGFLEAFLVVLVFCGVLALGGYLEEQFMKRPQASSPWTLERHRITVTPLCRARGLWLEWRTRHEPVEGEALMKRVGNLRHEHEA